MTPTTPTPSPVVFSDRMRRWFSGVTTRAGAAVNRMGIHPDWITVAGLIVVSIGSLFIAIGQFMPAAILLLISLPLDALDGAVARAMGRTDRRGAVLDSTLDRYADSFIFAGFATYYAAQSNLVMMLVALAALIGTYSVSYVRARAGEADLSVKVGLFSRFERLIVLLIMLFVPALMGLGLIVLAVGTNFTTGQRLLYVYKHLDRDGE